MEDLITSGRIVDVIIALVLIEAAALFIYHRQTGHGPAPEQITPTLLSGLCLMVALRAALTGASWIWIALGLTISLIAHLIDLRQRWRI